MLSKVEEKSPSTTPPEVPSFLTDVRELEQTSADEEQYFSKLLGINLRYIEKYYKLVEEHADKSYRLARWAARAGFLVLLAGMLISFVPNLGVAPKAVALGSGVLIEFVGAVFFYLYNRTVRQLNSYHEKLVNVQDAILALRVAQGINKNHMKLYNDTMRYLAESLMTSRLHGGREEKVKTLIERTDVEQSTNGARNGSHKG